MPDRDAHNPDTPDATTMDDERFVNLTLRYLDRLITRDEMDALNAALADDAERQRRFRELCIRSQVMSDALGGRRAAAEDVGAVIDTSTRRLRVTITALAMAAMVALAATIGVALIRGVDTGAPSDGVTAGAEATTIPQAVAMVADTINAQWGEGLAAEMMGAGQNIDTGPLRLVSGSAQLVLGRGAVITLVGRTDLDMTGDNRCTLRRGTLIAYVPDSATGFTVDVPGGSIVDLGTRFGVHVDDRGETEVHVINGSVKTTLTTPTGAVTHDLGDKQALRFDRSGATHEATYDEQRWAAPRRDGPIVSGHVVLLGKAPSRVDNGAFEHDTRIAMFRERSGVTLPREVTVTLTEPGMYSAFSERRATVPAGTTVTTYMLQYDPLGADVERSRTVRGSVTFDRPIVGVIAMTDQLNATDESLGAPGTRYLPTDRSSAARYLEDDSGDRLTLRADRRTLDIQLQANNSNDHIRVLIATEPAPADRGGK